MFFVPEAEHSCIPIPTLASKYINASNIETEYFSTFFIEHKSTNLSLFHKLLVIKLRVNHKLTCKPDYTSEDKGSYYTTYLQMAGSQIRNLKIKLIINEFIINSLRNENEL